ncbi:unnamed protein product [Paramecium sonneborni]|uniref:Uncharacterized protein n=1 Tax=Paramecium sonneborni TaxID=65129 RepID=A0A8S1RNI7_9CILI|nr:unnamed protein product [Paramecium sonneborni]
MAQDHLNQKKALLFLNKSHNDKQEEALSKKLSQIDIVGWKPHYPRLNDGKYVVHTTFQVKITKSKQITYISDGEILRKEKFHQKEEIKIYLNLDQIKSLKWKCSKEDETQTIVKYVGCWNGRLTNLGGIVDEFGYRIGEWIEPCDTYCSPYQITFSGTYGKKGQRIGQWIYWYEYERIGGGHYDENGRKNGQWCEIHRSYDHYQKVIIIGDYIKGMKKGRWSVFENNHLIGEGSYNENGQKIGKWTEVSESYQDYMQLIFGGQYKNGVRIGKWLTYYMGQTLCSQYTNNDEKVIGGGFYDEFGLKQGYWVEFYEGGYSYRAQFRIVGEYKNGLKNGFWRIIIFILDGDDVVGGGLYDDKGKKSGEWIEIIENGDLVLISEVGLYRYGVKFGQWDTYFLFNNQKIGGGCYNEQGLKSGQWIEQHDQNNLDQIITHSGEYNEGKKMGCWKTILNDEGLFSKIGGGFYNNQGQKIGQWIDILSQTYNELSLCNQIQLVLINGCYKDGEKNGQFDTYIYSKELTKAQKIGGGYYFDGMKVGKWIEINQNYSSNCIDSIIQHGRYSAGMKIGIWETSKAQKIRDFGYYGSNGDKEGKWIEQFIYTCMINLFSMGQYSKGKKIGIWQIMYLKSKKDIIIIDFGSYKDGIKHGKWIEIEENQITHHGYYNNGIKIGTWEKINVGIPSNEDLHNHFFFL